MSGSDYDDVSEFYDKWIGSSDDVDFYVSEAVEAGGQVLELGVGTGRVAVPTALRGVPVIGIDASQKMLDICRHRARDAGVEHLIDLRLGDMRRPPVVERVALVTCPLRTFSHLETDTDRRDALNAVRNCLQPSGRFVFDVPTPTPEQVSGLSSEWDTRVSGISEWAHWDRQSRQMFLSLRFSDGGSRAETHLRFAWLGRDEWRDLLKQCTLEVISCYGWFDRRPCAASPLSIWVARIPHDSQ